VTLAAPQEWIAKLNTPDAAGTSHLVVIGLNYHSSPIAIRERFIIPDYCLAHALQALARLPHIREAAVLSTCNRTEVYAVVSDLHAGIQQIESFFLSVQTIADHAALKPNFKLLREDVALHLFRVAAGLDSMVLGEGQIMSQVKSAYKAALEAGTTGPMLDQLFKLALETGKRVRSETSMGRRAVSVSSAAVELAREKLGRLANKAILIIGAGKMAKICAKLLLNESGAGRVIMINRTGKRVEDFAQTKLPNPDRFQSRLAYEDRHHLAAAADLIVVSTSAPEFTLEADKLTLPLGKELCIVDISVPRNVDPAIGTMPGVSLHHSDHLFDIVTANLAERETLVAEAQDIVFQSLNDFHAWQRSVLVAPTIAGLRRKIESIRVEHVRNSTRPEDEAKKLEQISRAIVNQILHHPTVQLKSARNYQALKQQSEALQALFELDIFSTDTNAAQGNGRPARGCPLSSH
jgi:glutamyl-tRNA reductase